MCVGPQPFEGLGGAAKTDFKGGGFAGAGRRYQVIRGWGFMLCVGPHPFVGCGGAAYSDFTWEVLPVAGRS